MGRLSKDGRAIVAAKRGNFDALKRSVTSLFGAKAGLVDTDGNTLLHWAAVSPNAQVLRFLIARRVPVNTQNKFGDTPLHWAAQVGRSYPCKLLLGNGANGSLAGRDGDMALHRAARYGHTEIVDMLAETGETSIDTLNAHGRTPLHEAAQGGYDETVEHLIRLSANIHADIADTGDTPLHLATSRGFGDVASLLVDAGADLKRPNKKGETGFKVYDPMRDFSSEPERTATLIRARAEEAKQLARSEAEESAAPRSEKTGSTDIGASASPEPTPLRIVASRQASVASIISSAQRRSSLKDKRSSIV